MLHSLAIDFGTGIPLMATEDQTRQRIRDWIEQIKASHDLSDRQVALRAKISPTTISRALDLDNKFLVSNKTIAKIQAAFPDTADMAAGLTDALPVHEAYRNAVWNVVFALHEKGSLQSGSAEETADAITELADWLLQTGDDSVSDSSSVIDFQAAKLKRAKG